MNDQNLPVAVIGAGPSGLAAAAQLIERGLKPIIIEAGDSVGASVLKWAHVRMFSPWKYNTDKASVKLLAASGWQEPEPENLPTGGELVNNYLLPFAQLPQVKDSLRLNTRVLSVAKLGFDKMKTEGRDEAPFVLHVRHSSGNEEKISARAVIDTSGTYELPNPVGASGVYALGEQSANNNIFYGIPDVLGTHRARYAKKRVVVVGSGHSAINAVLELGKLITEEPGTKVIWAVRRASTQTLFGGESKDELPARGLLGTSVRRLIVENKVHLYSNFKTIEIESTNEGLVLKSEHQSLPAADEIIVATGFRPDLEMLRELRLDLDQMVESPRTLAPLIDPNLHSCGTVYPHGAEELKHPEKDFYIAGMKSYGRAPTFLLMTGYEQIRSIVAAIAGDWESARRVELVLPETGVCKTDESGAECCGVSETFQLTRQKPVRIESTVAQKQAAVAEDDNCCAPDCCTPEGSVATSVATGIQIGRNRS